MKTYAELVKEAIREAHEKAENEYKKFEVGRTYATRSICNCSKGTAGRSNKKWITKK